MGACGRAGPRRIRRPLAIALGAAPVLLVIVAVLAAAPAGAPPTRILTEPPAPALPAPAPIAPATGLSGLPAPETIVALTETGAVVLLDAATGRTLRTLARHEAGSLQGLALAPDGRSAYYAVSSGCGDGVIRQVALDGATAPRLVAKGVSPALSPDGRQLAYAVAETSLPDGSGCHNVVVVRDLSSRTLRAWRYPDDELHRWGLYLAGSFTRISWAPDSTRLALTLSYEGDSVSVLDTARHRDLSQAEEVVIPGGGGDSRHPAWQPWSGRLAVVNSAFGCCFEDAYDGPPRTLLVDVPNRLSEDLLPAGTEPHWLDFDRSGEHLLDVDGDGRLSRRHLGGSPKPVVSGITAADW